MEDLDSNKTLSTNTANDTPAPVIDDIMAHNIDKILWHNLKIYHVAHKVR